MWIARFCTSPHCLYVNVTMAPEGNQEWKNTLNTWTHTHIHTYVILLLISKQLKHRHACKQPRHRESLAYRT
jgi:hypothetical protein